MASQASNSVTRLGSITASSTSGASRCHALRDPPSPPAAETRRPRAARRAPGTGLARALDDCALFRKCSSGVETHRSPHRRAPDGSTIPGRRRRPDRVRGTARRPPRAVTHLEADEVRASSCRRRSTSSAIAHPLVRANSQTQNGQRACPRGCAQVGELGKLVELEYGGPITAIAVAPASAASAASRLCPRSSDPAMQRCRADLGPPRRTARHRGDALPPRTGLPHRSCRMPARRRGRVDIALHEQTECVLVKAGASGEQRGHGRGEGSVRPRGADSTAFDRASVRIGRL